MTRGDDGRLVGWKAIGMFLGRDERTVRRWEAERGLPINRVPGGGSATVWALPEDLRHWMAGDHGVAASEATDPVELAPRSRGRWYALAASAIAIAAATPSMLATFGNAAVSASRPEPYGADSAANDLYRKASFGLSRRSVPGLLSAAGMFETLAKAHPRNATAFVGLAEANLLLREFNSLPNETAYRRAASAAQAALALDAKSATATRALAFVRYHGEGKRKEGLALFERALALDPDQAQSHHWYATALLSEGRPADALRAFDRARALDPASSAIAADAAYSLYLQGKHTDAIAELQRIIDVDPGFSGGYRYLARFFLIEGRDADYLAMARTEAKLRKDPQVSTAIDRAADAHKSGGRAAMVASLIAHEIAQFEQSGESALRVAMVAAAAGDAAVVVRWLEKAEAINEPEIRTISAYAEFVPYRDRIMASPALKPLITGT
jgi:tetratricopeptide (TPR) repeat protein